MFSLSEKMLVVSSVIVVFLTASALLLAEDPQCTRWQKNLSTLCLSKTTGFFKKFHEHPLDDPQKMAEFNLTSEEIIKCFHDLPCRKTREDKISNRVKAYRDTIFALTEPFHKCYRKLDSRNSECFYSWDPFLGVDEDGRILESFDKRDICKSYFGPKDCMKFEIVEHCTVDAWRKFKKSAKEFGEKIYGCDFRDVFVFPIRRNY